MRKRLALSFFSLVLSGCAGAGQMVGKPPVIEYDNFATIHIARPSGVAGCGIRMNIQIDHEDFYLLACGEQLNFKVPANKDVTISETRSLISDHVLIEPEKGKHYYLENDCNGWACWLQEIKKGNFNKVAVDCENTIDITSDGQITTTQKSR